MHVTWPKLLALLIAAGYMTLLLISPGIDARAVLQLTGAMLLPLMLIWFPETLGSLTGHIGRGGHIDTETPPWLVAAAGWFLLAGLPVLIYLLS